ncbi:MAG: hypothetical protein K2M88_02090 [Muribaculaceae bacterium]|nr:hypothetical protein [Muribaculaceae bacterium]
MVLNLLLAKGSQEIRVKSVKTRETRGEAKRQCKYDSRELVAASNNKDL